MKKIVKMSLVAAVAVAGLTTANAKPLEEAIKNVDVSGSVVYRYDDSSSDAINGVQNTNDQTNKYKVGLNLKSKVNDDVALSTRFTVNSGFAGFDTATGNDTDVNVQLSQVYFGYTGVKNTTVNVGKQGLATPWTVATDINGNEQTGSGVLALSTVGPVTLGAGYFNQTNLNESGNFSSTGSGTSLNLLNKIAGSSNGQGNNSGANDIAVLAALANVGPVALDAWYLDMSDIFDTYTLGAKAGLDVSGIALGANVRYTALSLDRNANATAAGVTDANDEHDMIQFALTAKAGIVDAKYAIAKTDKEGGVVALDNDASGSIQGWSVNPLGKADATFHQAVLGVQALDSLHVSANYVTVKYNGSNSFAGTAGTSATLDEQETEIYAQLVYKMSSNLTSYVRFGTEERETDGAKATELDYKGRLQVAYTF